MVNGRLPTDAARHSEHRPTTGLRRMRFDQFQPNADRWEFVKKLRLIRVEYRQKASAAKNQGFSTCW
jgi:hypothetical protein